MQVKGAQLGGVLARATRDGRMAPLWTVTGDEPLLAIEAADAIRATARALGYTEREVIHLDARADWSQLIEAASGLSLFAERKLLELRLPSGKPGKSGGEALERLAQSCSGEVVAILSLPRLDKSGRESRWFTALGTAGVVVEIWPVDRAHLPAWIADRLKQQGQRAAPEALEFVADRVEGNLLAAHQEIAKLGLLFPARELTLEEVRDAVLNVSRFELTALPAALLAGDAERVARTLDGLQAEGTAIPLILWALLEDIRALLKVKAALDAGRPLPQAIRDARVWGPREDGIRRAVNRVSRESLESALAHAADIDRISKGLRAPGRDSDPWIELKALATALAGRSTAP
ncbi:MAG: DNA polymerase III subunit delta [Burkholderiaceae bacterium]